METKKQIKAEFDLNKIYYTVWTKKKLIEYINASYDKRFQVILLPILKDSADILIRDVKSND